MDNGLLSDLFAFVDRFRQNEEILKTLEMPGCRIFVGLPDEPNLLTSDQVIFVKDSLIELVKKEQNDTWSKMTSLMDIGSPYQ